MLLLTILHFTSLPTYTQTPPGVLVFCFCLFFLGWMFDCVSVWRACPVLLTFVGVFAYTCVCVCVGRGTPPPPLPPRPSSQPKHSGFPRLHCLSRCRPLLLLLILASPPPQVPVLLQSSMPLWPARTTAQASLSHSFCLSHTHTHTSLLRSSSFLQWTQKKKKRWRWDKVIYPKKGPQIVLHLLIYTKCRID